MRYTTPPPLSKEYQEKAKSVMRVRPIAAFLFFVVNSAALFFLVLACLTVVEHGIPLFRDLPAWVMFSVLLLIVGPSAFKAGAWSRERASKILREAAMEDYKKQLLWKKEDWTDEN